MNNVLAQFQAARNHCLVSKVDGPVNLILLHVVESCKETTDDSGAMIHQLVQYLGYGSRRIVIVLDVLTVNPKTLCHVMMCAGRQVR